jgi:hypothetical protein
MTAIEEAREWLDRHSIDGYRQPDRYAVINVELVRELLQELDKNVNQAQQNQGIPVVPLSEIDKQIPPRPSEIPNPPPHVRRYDRDTAWEHGGNSQTWFESSGNPGQPPQIRIDPKRSATHERPAPKTSPPAPRTRQNVLDFSSVSTSRPKYLQKLVEDAEDMGEYDRDEAISEEYSEAITYSMSTDARHAGATREELVEALRRIRGMIMFAEWDRMYEESVRISDILSREES